MNPDTTAANPGFKEAVISVRDLDLWRGLCRTSFGWDECHMGETDPAQLRQWQLGPPVTAREAVYHCGEEPQGFVRLVQFSGCAQIRIRAGAMPWDTGGIFSLMVRSHDATGFAAEMMNRGWTAITDPLTFDYNGQLLTNVILRGPEGICLGVYERVDPKLAGWPHIKRISQPFNAMQMVRSRDAARDFFRQTLDCGAYVDADMQPSQPKDSNFGIPRNVTTQVTTRAAIMHPNARPDARERDNGRVELIQWDGLEGRDLADRAIPPNLGHLALRFPVRDLGGKARDLAAAGFSLFAEPAGVRMPPYGEVTAASLRTPDGVLIELFE